MKKKESKGQNVTDIGRVVGDTLSRNAQNASNTGIDGMNLLRQKINSLGAAQFDQAKGNYFEYIEAAKFNVDAAQKGATAKAIVTDAVGRPHAEADIEIFNNGVKVKDIQAKFIKSSMQGRDNSAASSVHHQTGAHNKGWGQYDGMDRLIRKEEHYNKDGSLLYEAKKLARERSKTGIHKDVYKDVEEHLTDETHYDGVTSHGTGLKEVKKAYNDPDKYIKEFEQKQFGKEIRMTTTSMAAASFVTTGVISGVQNFYKVFKDEKTLGEAIVDTTKDAVKSGAKGAATGFVSSNIRISAVKSGNKLLSDSAASLAVAGGIIDGGVSLLKYAKGEIDSQTLKEDLVATVVKSTSLVIVSNVLKAAAAGAAINPLVSMTTYIVLGIVIDGCKEMIHSARLQIEECEKLKAIYIEARKESEKQNKKLSAYLEKLTTKQKQEFDGFINRFDYDIQTGQNYDDAISSIVELSNYLGIELQHVKFDDFKEAMKSDDPFKLE